ncbi:carboxylating nicotinate-nucleotide diphosphorylase [Pontivivens ytuae]|uniref:Probable nicotinate-nucleotide pyrophosphorylase [carboxylating] n=1 Tax=Pontivivens ytuae TaxID=2789856 RepID=A0A7S9LV19_9RHOB|nr:carboxylating nicotinate-nucleotide diphosphorylase [Pontivivens ytuae]QPH55797.1 carboxylating nicotinate-nucleotide diphosphorylase [Pontivivens ytuae]
MRKPYIPVLPPPLVSHAVEAALLEDMGQAGDLTSLATIAPHMHARAVINAREAGTIAGQTLARAAFAAMDAGCTYEALVEDGAKVKAGQDLAVIEGPARAVMSAERVALNYLMHLSGIATHTARFVAEVEGTDARITCTRKTTPGLRAFEKYAVRCGGGASHRYGLDDAVLIKDNHIAVCGGVREALEHAYAYVGHLVGVEIEVDNLDQFSEALGAGARIVLLDNMSLDDLRKAVAMNTGAVLEASGGVDIDTARAIAETGVNYISTSKITMSAGTLDIGLDIDITE